MSSNTSTGNLTWADIDEIDNSIVKSQPKSINRMSYSSIVKPKSPKNIPKNNIPKITGFPSNTSIIGGEFPCIPKNDIIPKIDTHPKNENPVVKRRKQCYTCKPRGKVLKHIIRGTGSEEIVFHYDLHKRPIILITPKKHYENIYEIPHDEIIKLLESIRTFCDFWKINDYQVSYNNGSWQTHPHFHIKIKANEKIINRMRSSHFRMHKLENNYSK
jgi:diadenosine tetraphosphate (Ap4A) HIT family hydrolase